MHASDSVARPVRRCTGSSLRSALGQPVWRTEVPRCRLELFKRAAGARGWRCATSRRRPPIFAFVRLRTTIKRLCASLALPQVVQADRGLRAHTPTSLLRPSFLRLCVVPRGHTKRTLRARRRTRAGSPLAQQVPRMPIALLPNLVGDLAPKRTKQSKSHRPHNLVPQFLKLIIGLFLKATPQKSANVTSLAWIWFQSWQLVKICQLKGDVWCVWCIVP